MEDIFLNILCGFPAIIIALTVHEFFHAFTAFRCGDPTAKYENRVSLNPLAHIDPVGAVILFMTLLVSPFVVGWAKPVPVSERYLGKPRRDIFLVSFAGPLSNMALAFLAGIFIRLGAGEAMPIVGLFLLKFVSVNLSLGLFNLLPVPPLDGWKIIQAVLPSDIVYKMKNLETRSPYVTYAILAIVIFSGIVQIVLGPPYRLLYTLFTSQ